MADFEKEQALVDAYIAYLTRTEGKEIYGPCTFGGYEDVGRKTFGLCRYPKQFVAEILLGERYPWDKCELFRRAVIYHETIHAYLYLVDGVCNSHDAEFQRLRKKKPLLWIADGVMKFVWFWK